MTREKRHLKDRKGRKPSSFVHSVVYNKISSSFRESAAASSSCSVSSFRALIPGWKHLVQHQRQELETTARLYAQSLQCSLARTKDHLFPCAFSCGIWRSAAYLSALSVSHLWLEPCTLLPYQGVFTYYRWLSMFSITLLFHDLCRRLAISSSWLAREHNCTGAACMEGQSSNTHRNWISRDWALQKCEPNGITGSCDVGRGHKLRQEGFVIC
jgi:hypothetical protein